MKKWMTALLIAILALPVFGTSVFAEADSIYADGEYKINVDIKKEHDDEASIAGNYVADQVDFKVENGNQFIEMKISSASVVQEFKAVDYATEVIATDEEENTMVVRFPIDGDLAEAVMMEMHIIVPGIYDDRHTVRAFFDASEVELRATEPEPEPEPEPEQPEEPVEPEVPGDGEEEPEVPEDTPTKEFKDLITEADESYEITYVTDSRAVNGQFNNPATLHVVDGKNYIQMDVKSGDIINWLTINGVSLDWGEQNADGTYTVQFEHPGNLSDVIVLGMEIQAGPRTMVHDVDLTFDESSMKLIEEEGTEFIVDPESTQYVEYVSESKSVARQFNNPAAVIVKDGKTYIQMSGTGGQYIASLTINGEEVTWGERNDDGTFTFQFELTGNLSDVLDFGMVIDTGRPGADPMEHTVDLSFDESTLRDTPEVIEEEPEVPAEPEEPTEPETPEVVGELVPDNAYEIDYTILQENSDEVSASMNFMESNAILLVKDGVKYLQISSKADSGQYIKSLRVKLGNEYHEMVIVDKTADGRTIFQLRVDGELSDVILIDMYIDAGIYKNEHKARLVLDPNSATEVDASNYLLVASTNDNGPDAPEGEEATNPEEETERPIEEDEATEDNSKEDTTGVEKPAFGDPETDESAAATGTNGNPTNNPQTGENTNLLLYVLLLVGSAIPLAVQARRRFVA